MNLRKIFRRAVSMLFVVSIMLFAAVTHAEIYTGEGSYVMSKVETLEVARERAKADAMRNASEQAFVYVKSYSRSKNFELEEDIIETMTANILKLVEKPIFKMLEEVDNLEGLMIRVTVKVQIDDSDITRWLNKDEQEKSTLVSQMEALRKANEEQARQIAELKRQLANNPQDTEKITKQFAEEDKIFLSNQKVDEGWKLYNKGDYNGAVKLHSEAVELNPNNALAYYGRGTAYNGLKQYEQSIPEFNKAIKLNPKHSMTYNNRGVAYMDGLKQYERAIQDYNKAIELDPNNFIAYGNRGISYNWLKQNKLAIKDCDKSIKINPKYAAAYCTRGWAYDDLGQHERAIKDYDKAIELDPNDEWAYSNRGVSYVFLKNFKQAIDDATNAIKINPNHVTAYLLRGMCYQKLGDEAKAQADFAKAKELGLKY